MGCDSYVVSVYKWFVGFKEVGIFYMKKDCIINFWFNNFGYDVKIVLFIELYIDVWWFEIFG